MIRWIILKKSVFLFSFAGPFSRYADSRLGKFIRDELRLRIEEGNYHLPLDAVVWWTDYWEGLNNWDENFIRSNPSLAMYIVQQDSGAKNSL